MAEGRTRAPAPGMKSCNECEPHNYIYTSFNAISEPKVSFFSAGRKETESEEAPGTCEQRLRFAVSIKPKDAIMGSFSPQPRSLVLVCSPSFPELAAIRKLVRDGVFGKSVEEIVDRKLLLAEKTTLSSSYSVPGT